MGETHIQFGLRNGCLHRSGIGLCLLQFATALIEFALRGRLFFNQPLAASQLGTRQYDTALRTREIGFCTVERGAVFAIIDREQSLPALDFATLTKMHGRQIARHAWA